jgi:uncharacterized phage protein gp47/JayE
MTVSIDDLTKPVTRDEAKASIYDALGIVGVNTTAWRPGAVVRTIIAVVAILFSACTRLIAGIAKAGFLEYAANDWLTLVARHVYGVERLEATFGTGALRLVNGGGGVFNNVAPGDLIVRNPVTNKTYTNTTLFSLGAGATLDIPIVAQEAGSASTSGVGAITGFVTPLINVTCTNTTAVVGADAEGDAPLRLRCREVLGARSANGPADAHASIARSAKRADGSAIGVTRVRTVKDGRGNGYIYLATAVGGVPGDAENIATDLGIINDRIQRQAAPLGFTAHVLSATPLSINVSYRVWLLDTSGLTHAQLAALIATALGNYFAAAPIGGYVIDGQPGRIYLEDIKGAIKAVRPEIFHVEIDGLTADIDVGPNFAPVLGASIPVAITESQQRVV